MTRCVKGCGQQRRDLLRDSGTLTAEEESALIRESQYMKAELKRCKTRWQEKISEAEDMVIPLCERIAAMKEERKYR